MRHTRRNLAAVLLLAGLAAYGQQTRLKPGFNLFSKKQDVELGREAAAQISQQVKIVNDADLNNYLNRVGRRLVEAPEADAASFPYTFQLVHDGSINAFALPGGPTFVHTGLIAAAENEAQLAGVMAHEIAHVALRHGTNQATKQMGAQLLLGAVGAAVGGGELLQQLGGLGAMGVLLKYSRTAERQADLLGARIMSRAGYNPIEMARFFERLEAEGGSRGPDWLSSHPNPGNRVAAVDKEIRSMPQAQYGGGTGQFETAKARVQSLGAPPKPAAANSHGRGWRRVR
jgi:predicted Zn-dependent protease